MIRLTQKILPSAIVLAAAFSLVGGCKKAATAPSRPEPTVTTAEVVATTVPIQRTFSGTVNAVKSVEILPQVTGYLEEIHFTEGALVKEGDLLYTIDPRPFQAALDQAKAQLVQDKASAAFYAKEAERYEKAEASNATSVQLMQQAEAARDEADASVAKDQAAVQAAELDLGYTKITAPFTGRAQLSQVKKGAILTEDQTALTTLVQLNPMYVDFALSRSEIFRLQAILGENFLESPDVGVTLFLPNGKAHPEKGTIDFVGTNVNPLTDSITVRAVVPNSAGDGPDLNLIAGQYAKVVVTLGQQKDAIIIPKEALVETQAGTQVYLVGSDGKVASRQITQDRAYEQYMVVSSGLKPGEQAIVSGLQLVKPGISVKTREAEPAGGASAAESTDPTPAPTATPAATPTPTPAS